METKIECKDSQVVIKLQPLLEVMFLRNFVKGKPKLSQPMELDVLLHRGK